MPYIVTTTSGSALATIADNSINTTTTSLTLVGKNYAGYGSFLNENYIRLLENFSNSTSPTAPMTGQLWYDSTNVLLKVYTGSQWKQIHTSAASSTAPTSPVTGDIWWDTSNLQFKVWSGSTWVVIGPNSTTGTGSTSTTSGAIVDTIVDTTSLSHAVIKLNITNSTIGIISKDSTFTPQTAITGFGNITPGVNLINSTALPGSQYSSSQLTVGNASTLTITDVSGAIRLTNNTLNSDLNLYVNKANVSTTAIGITASTGLVSIPGALTVTGITTLSSNVSITGVTTTSGGILPVSDNTIELGSSSLKYANVWATTFRGTAITAKYADLAERFEADAPLTPGTVVELGGTKEITTAVQELSEEVFGVISTLPGFLLNGTAGPDDTHPPVAASGRVPVRVVGHVKKGDRLVSAGNGLARAASRNELTPFNIIGRALEDKFTDGEGLIEAIVKLNS